MTKKGGRTQLNACGSTRNLTSLIDKDILLQCEMMIKIALSITKLGNSMLKTWHLFFSHDLRGMSTKKGGRTQLNARGSTSNLTSLIDKDLPSQCKIRTKIVSLLQSCEIQCQKQDIFAFHMT